MQNNDESKKSNKASELILGTMVIIGLVIYGLGKFTEHNNAVIDARVQRMMAEEKAANAKGQPLVDACKVAVTQGLAPTPVLNWIYDHPDFSETSTGFKTDVSADIGGKIINVDCYHDKAGAILKVVKTN